MEIDNIDGKNREGGGVQTEPRPHLSLLNVKYVFSGLFSISIDLGFLFLLSLPHLDIHYYSNYRNIFGNCKLI